MAISSLPRPKMQVITATGGDDVFDRYLVDEDGVYRIHRFLESDTFTVTSGVGTVEALIQAGGGGGGRNTVRGARGGAAGGLLVVSDIPVDSVTGDYTITVGVGGTGGTSALAGNGGNSTAFGFTAVGGGGALQTDTIAAGAAGGSGGGGFPGGAGTPGQGTNGSSMGGIAGSLDLTLNFDGVPFTYASASRNGGRGANQKPLKEVEFGRGGHGGNGNDDVGQGGDGADGIVIIRYRVRSL